MIVSERLDIGVQQCNILSESQKKAVEAYTSCGYLDINQCLRGKNNTETMRHIKSLMELFAQTQDTIVPNTFQDMVLYRGMYFHTLPDMNIGDTITNHGFVSTSSLASVAKRYLKLDNGNITKPFCCLMEVHFKPGQAYKILKICQNSQHADEEEYLLPSGGMFHIKDKVVDKTFLTSITRYIVDYIPPKANSAPSTSYGGCRAKKLIYSVSPGVKITLAQTKP